MAKLHVQSFTETNEEVTFVLMVKDDSFMTTYGFKTVVVTQPLNFGKLVAAIGNAETEILDTTSSENFVRSFIERKNRGDA